MAIQTLNFLFKTTYPDGSVEYPVYTSVKEYMEETTRLKDIYWPSKITNELIEIEGPFYDDNS
tara:strand:- start:1339 stop:1527 length:189 start_codon:yes stop_codon:yes gene_type:complete